MKKFIVLITIFALTLTSSYADDAKDIFSYMEELNGEWVLSKTKKQKGSCAFDAATLEKINTGIAFKFIGMDTTIQEDLLSGTARQMVTMYHA